MPQEVSISYQAVKSKVYKLVDAMVEGDKNPVEVQESIRRWWNLIHPSDRAVAQKYLLMVLEKSNPPWDPSCSASRTPRNRSASAAWKSSAFPPGPIEQPSAARSKHLKKPKRPGTSRAFSLWPPPPCHPDRSAAKRAQGPFIALASLRSGRDDKGVGATKKRPGWCRASLVS